MATNLAAIVKHDSFRELQQQQPTQLVQLAAEVDGFAGVDKNAADTLKTEARTIDLSRMNAELQTMREFMGRAFGT
jgi:hypothetical protein